MPNARTGLYYLQAILVLACVGCGPRVPEEVRTESTRLPEEVSWNLHVRPILSDRCFKCHGPDANTRKTALRFDTEAGALVSLTESARKRAIVAGKPGQSEMVHRILSDDPTYRMPPQESNLTLSPHEIATLIKWIEKGGQFERHWSLVPPVVPARPIISDSTEIRNEIDRFIRARLERDGIEPSPEASREQLIRRVSFDLTGLPPSVPEIDAFLQDSAPGAYERLVDRLLDSPAYGERMASIWLDLARYADSHGYQDDGWRNMWPWRDWVIRSFNNNMPYDEFATWQLAGDLFEEPTQEQRLATGFNRNHLQSQEGGIVAEEYRVDYVVDRTNTFGKAFMGLTVECAQCHDHKYDPVSQAEYYSLFAFFNSVNEYGNIPYSGEASPVVILTDDVTDQKLAEVREKIRDLEQSIEPENDRFSTAYSAWRRAVTDGSAKIAATPEGLIAHYPLDRFLPTDSLIHLPETVQPGIPGYFWGDRDLLPTEEEGRIGGALHLRGDGWLDMGNKRFQFERNEPFSLALWFKTDSSGVAGPLFSKSGGLFNGKRGYGLVLNKDGTLSASLNHVFPDNSIEVQSADTIRSGMWQHVVMTYDGSSRADGLILFLDGNRMPTHVRVDNLQQSIRFAIDPATGDTSNWGDPGNLRIGFLGGNLPRLKRVSVDDFRVYDRSLSDVEVEGLFDPSISLDDRIRTYVSDNSAASDQRLRAFFVQTRSDEFTHDFSVLTSLRGRENEILTARPSVMVLNDLPAPRKTHILNRGAYDSPGDEVKPATPASILAFSESYPRNRLGLAKWLFDPENPLTARVEVNRLWQQVFGRGLVETADNFGSQGTMPTHPELLDWLAIEFRESGWDIKSMLRLMVLSATYRESSQMTDKLREIDPENRLLARSSGNRLSAEMIRDHALASSGLLVPTVGGPSVKPYQPAGLWKELATRNATEYVQDHGDNLYRRSLYTVWKRTTPPPSMMNFDASERNICIIRRQRTNTPLQALVLLNDPQYAEASRILAEKMIREGGVSTEDQIVFGFRGLTSRHPDSTEVTILTQLFNDQYEQFSVDPLKASAMMTSGEYRVDTRVDPVRTAALAVVASAMMNFDESVTKR